MPDGDSAWFDAVNWAVIATIQAEEFGITSENVAEMAASEDPDIRSFLGQPSGEDNTVLDPGLDLDPDFAVNVIEQVGNYGEIFDRNVGAGSTARPRAWPQRPLDRRRAALRPALPVGDPARIR